MSWQIDCKNINDNPDVIYCYGEKIKSGLKNSEFIAWFAYSRQGGGCGGQHDYSVGLYTVEVDNGNIYVWHEGYHDDSCNGKTDFTGKYVSEDMWTAEGNYMADKFNVIIPLWPDNITDDTLNDVKDNH